MAAGAPDPALNRCEPDIDPSGGRCRRPLAAARRSAGGMVDAVRERLHPLRRLLAERSEPPDLSLFLYAGMVLALILVIVAVPYLISYLFEIVRF